MRSTQVSKPAGPPRSLLCLQYFEDSKTRQGDRLRAYETLRYYADIQKERCEVADILMVRRRGTPVDRRTEQIIKHISRKFNVLLFETDRHEVGWPAGPNGMVFSIFNYVFSMQAAGKFAYDNFVLLESDAYPLMPDWIAKLQADWIIGQKKNPKSVIMGDLVDDCPHPECERHVNGNLMMTTDPTWLAKLVKLAGCRGDIGWDWEFAPMFHRHGIHDSPLVRSEWGIKTASPKHLDKLFRQGVVLYHGCKDNSVLTWGRKKYGLPI